MSRRLPDIRWFVLAVAVALTLPGWPCAWLAAIPCSASPLVALGSSIAVRGLPWLALAGLPGLALAAWRPRAFCRYACPAGLLCEKAGRLNTARRESRFPPMGRWIFPLVLGGAAVGYPLLLWLDPMAVLSAFLNSIRHPVASSAWIAAAAGLPLLLLLSAWKPGLWCGRLCPLGALQDAISGLRRRGAGGKPPAANGERKMAGNRRRQFLAACAGLAAGAAARATGSTPERPPKRPPGAADESRFGGLCVRCGSCARVCPTHIVRPDIAGADWTGWLAPALSFENGYCLESCRRCTEACPSGALSRLSPVEKRRWIIGLARVNLDTCWLASGRECTACIKACPYQALSVASDGFDTAPLLDESRCNGCGACEAVCPVQPRAIRVRPAAPYPDAPTR